MACALDISKAFDKVDHFALLQLLMDRNLPRCFIGVLLDWFTRCFVCACSVVWKLLVLVSHSCWR